MTYFRELPNINYQSMKGDRSSSEDFIQVKNIFRRAKLRDEPIAQALLGQDHGFSALATIMPPGEPLDGNRLVVAITR